MCLLLKKNYLIQLMNDDDDDTIHLKNKEIFLTQFLPHYVVKLTSSCTSQKSFPLHHFNDVESIKKILFAVRFI